MQKLLTRLGVSWSQARQQAPTMASSQRHQALPRGQTVRLPGCNDLRDAAAAGVREVAPGQPVRRGEAQGGQGQHSQGHPPGKHFKHMPGLIGGQGQQHGCHADHAPAEHEQRPALPTEERNAGLPAATNARWDANGYAV